MTRPATSVAAESARRTARDAHVVEQGERRERRRARRRCGKRVRPRRKRRGTRRGQQHEQPVGTAKVGGDAHDARDQRHRADRPGAGEQVVGELHTPWRDNARDLERREHRARAASRASQKQVPYDEQIEHAPPLCHRPARERAGAKPSPLSQCSKSLDIIAPRQENANGKRLRPIAPNCAKRTHNRDAGRETSLVNTTEPADPSLEETSSVDFKRRGNAPPPARS